LNKFQTDFYSSKVVEMVYGHIAGNVEPATSAKLITLAEDVEVPLKDANQRFTVSRIIVPLICALSETPEAGARVGAAMQTTKSGRTPKLK